MAAINGTSGDDSLDGTSGNDTINGFGGDDTINGQGGSDRLNGGSGNDLVIGGVFNPFIVEGGDVLVGGDGNDTLDGNNHLFAGSDRNVDTLDGGFGNDVFQVDNTGDVLLDCGGVDLVRADTVNWILGAGFENLFLNNGENEGFLTGIGNAGANRMEAGWSVVFDGRGGNDTLLGSTRQDILRGGDGNDLIDGGGFDDQLEGGAGNDTLIGGEIFAVADTMTGGAGADHFDIARGLKIITDFATAADKIRLDGDFFANAGPSGNFAPADERFFAAPGATTAHDGTDRVIYDTATGNLYYDQDGTGSADPFLAATLEGPRPLVARDIEVINGSAPVGGTAGDDLLVGRDGNDTLMGLAGHDTLNGGAGDDWLQGGGWSDKVTGGAGADRFVYAEVGTNQVDRVTDFLSGTDEVVLENGAMAALGEASAWTAGDERFHAAAGATAGHDADDRIIYNLTTGSLYYDGDGSGAGAAQIIATFQGAPGMTATDITVI